MHGLGGLKPPNFLVSPQIEFNPLCNMGYIKPNSGAYASPLSLLLYPAKIPKTYCVACVRLAVVLMRCCNRQQVCNRQVRVWQVQVSGKLQHYRRAPWNTVELCSVTVLFSWTRTKTRTKKINSFTRTRTRTKDVQKNEKWIKTKTIETELNKN